MTRTPARLHIFAPAKGMALALSALALVTVLSMPTGRASSLFESVVSVGEVEITGYEVDQTARILALEAGAPDSSEFRERAIEKLIDERLTEQEAQRVRIGVSEAEVNNTIANIAGNSGLERDEWENVFLSAGVEIESLLRTIRSQLLWQRLVRARYLAQVQGEIEGSEIEIARRMREYEGSQEYAHRIYRIVLPFDPQEGLARAKQLASDIRSRIADGEQFAELAKIVSRAPDASTGGEIGWRRDQQLTEEERRLFHSLPVLGTSDPIPTGERTVTIFHVGERTLVVPQGVDPLRFNLAQFLYPLPADASREEQDEAIAALEQIRSDGQGCAPRNPANEQIQRDVRTEMPVEEIGPPVRQMILSLSVGEATDILLTSTDAFFVFVCERMGGIREEARDQVRASVIDSLMSERLTALSQTLLAELKARASIERHPQ